MVGIIKRFIRLLEEKIGLNPSSVNERVWKKILSERMSICGINDIEIYYQRIIANPIELQEFIELVVVPETWFFRDRSALDFLKEYALDKWIEKSRYKPLMILSLPCSSGEEPYSIAMALFDAHFPSSRFHIDAIDISKKMIAKAELGEYGRNSFRSKDLTFRDRYFDKISSGYLLQKSVIKQVHFSYGNFFEPGFLVNKPQYDVVFCRNLFIYLHPEAQKNGFSILDRLLADEGILIVSPAEAEFIRNMGYILLSQPRACAFGRSPATLEKAVPVTVKHTRALANKQAKIRAQKMEAELEKEARLLNDKKSRALAEKEVEKQSSLKEANRLADNGYFDEATALCLNYLEKHGVNPEAYFLLGLIQHATGFEDRAEEFFLKTVYLAPDHYEALTYLALLAEKKGDERQAELFRQRAQRYQDLSS
jgi:chemotaxis protein methyltransferase WspC